MRYDEALHDHARDHFGIVGLGEALALDVPTSAVRTRVDSGILIPIHDGAYRHAAAPDVWEGRLRAALLAAGPTAVASGASAMRLYGVRGEWAEQIELTTVGANRHRLHGVRARRIDRLTVGDVQHRMGMPVLAPPLALLLLGAVVNDRKVETAVHDMVHLHLTARGRLLDVLDRYGGRGRRGTRRLRLAVRSLPVTGRATESNLELDLLRLLRAHCLPEPIPQFPIVDCAGVRRRLDLAYPAEMLDLEVDGDRWHTSASARAADRRRDAALSALGWTVLRFGSPDIHVWPDRTVATVRASLVADARISGVSDQRTQVG